MTRLANYNIAAPSQNLGSAPTIAINSTKFLKIKTQILLSLPTSRWLRLARYVLLSFACRVQSQRSVVFPTSRGTGSLVGRQRDDNHACKDD
jgi:hypothetical protein